MFVCLFLFVVVVVCWCLLLLFFLLFLFFGFFVLVCMYVCICLCAHQLALLPLLICHLLLFCSACRSFLIESANKDSWVKVIDADRVEPTSPPEAVRLIDDYEAVLLHGDLVRAFN